ncbi:HK97-gp10 family putative phage morphogenesis protein [Candidatus Pantoea multigeneris]|uniref:HK97 gp10 family phage protein n=1 Tax=Candidatus Pantoea multigeneris TaxID=2608357 RepID=A0ABX0R592_9GAMM|nr:HK97-gp10 family putative phage morphogenesis protein [Pantoea multigeneris]NIF20581.1 hypothetical protein [Pantoea multigeneris]
MINSRLDFSDLLDLSADLDVLSKAENNKVVRDMTRAAATVFKDEVIERAPELTGKLKKNVVVMTQRDRNGNITSGVHIRGTNPETGNSDNKMKADNPNNAYYWRFVELGTSRLPATPFVRPAYEAKQDDATKAAFERANQAIDEALSK